MTEPKGGSVVTAESEVLRMVQETNGIIQETNEIQQGVAGRQDGLVRLTRTTAWLQALTLVILLGWTLAEIIGG